MKFKLHSNPILKDLANMAVLALKFYIPSKSRTPPRFSNESSKSVARRCYRASCSSSSFSFSDAFGIRDFHIRFTARRCIARERKGDCQYDIPENKTSFSHSIWNTIGTFAHRRVQQDVQKDMGCEKETLTHRFEHCDHPDCASAIPRACLPRRVFFFLSPSHPPLPPATPDLK